MSTDIREAIAESADFIRASSGLGDHREVRLMAASASDETVISLGAIRALHLAATTEQDLYWAAGYFDARGSIYVQARQVLVIIIDKDEEVLSRFARVAGLDFMALSRPPVSGGDDGRTTCRLNLSARPQVKRLLTLFRPLMTRRELMEKADAALEWISRKEAGGL